MEKINNELLSLYLIMYQCRNMFCLRMRELMEDEDGIGTVEMILILIVLIALVIIFRDQLKTIVNDLFDKVTTQSNSV